MELSTVQRQKIISILQSKVNFGECIICKSSVGYEIPVPLELRQYNEGIELGGAPITPIVVVFCKNCGHVQMFSAVMLGIVNPNNGKIAI